MYSKVAAVTIRQVELNVRERILNATIQLIASDGLDSVRHRSVAELAEVSPGSTTYHFATRDDLIEAAFEQYLGQLDELIEQVWAGLDDSDPEEFVIAMIESLIALEFQTPSRMQAEYEMVLFAARTPSLGAKLREWEHDRWRNVSQVLSRAGAHDPDTGARTIIALIRGLEVERLIWTDSVVDLRPRLTPVVRSLLQ